MSSDGLLPIDTNPAPGFISPVIAGAILDMEGDLESKWRNIFQLEAAVLFTGAGVFCLLGSGRFRNC